MFVPGMKVECVDVDNLNWTASWIQKGGIYTIARVCREDHSQFHMLDHLRCTVTIHLVGILKPNGFSALRFRPIVERKTDISFAHEILRKNSNKVCV